ncbi:MAG: hypothetical protein IJJ25_02970 [Lachnospiraceae bacterium]|nr:hypothetical protein [Lachnospiraceae bacterium]
MKKRILLMLTAVLVAVSLTACAKPTAQSVMKKMAEASANKDMTEAVWDLDMGMGMKMDLFNIDMSMSMKLNGTTRSLTAEMLTESDVKMSADLGFTKQDMDMKLYTKQEDDTHISVYTMVEGEWFKTVTEIPEGSAAAGSTINLAGFEDRFTLAEEKETVNGAGCYKLTGELPVEEMMEQLNTMGVSNTVMETGDMEMFKGKSFMTVLYTDEKTSLPVRIELKLADSTVPAESESAESTASAETDASTEYEKEPEIDAGENIDASVTLDKMEMNMDFTYPEDISITIPEEALNAQEISENGLSDLMEEEADTSAEENYEPSGSMFDSTEEAQVIKEFADDEALLFRSDEMEIRAVKAYKDKSGIVYVDFDFNNKSAKNINIASESLSVNGVMSDDGLFELAEAGKDVVCTLMLQDMGNKGITEPGEMKLLFLATDNDTGDEVFRTDLLALTIGDAPAAAPKDGGKTVFENDLVKVIAYPEENGDDGHLIPLCIVNKSSGDLSLETIESAVEGVEINCYCYAFITAGNLAYTEAYIDDAELADKQIEGLSGLNIRLTATEGSYSGEEQKELFTTDKIILVD